MLLKSIILGLPDEYSDFFRHRRRKHLSGEIKINFVVFTKRHTCQAAAYQIINPVKYVLKYAAVAGADGFDGTP
jgi:hypothetical protein